MFVSKFFSLRAWAPLRGKFSVSRAVVAILQMLLLPKGTLDQRFKNKRFATSWKILGNPCRAPWSRNEVSHAVQCSETLHQKKAKFDNLFCKSTLKIVYKAFIKNSELCFVIPRMVNFNFSLQ